FDRRSISGQRVGKRGRGGTVEDYDHIYGSERVGDLEVRGHRAGEGTNAEQANHCDELKGAFHYRPRVSGMQAGVQRYALRFQYSREERRGHIVARGTEWPPDRICIRGRQGEWLFG